MEANNSVSVYYESFGSVEGVLECITIQDCLVFVICESLATEGEAMWCQFPSDLIEEARNVTGERVSVSGLIRSREDGKKVSIEVKEVHYFPSEEQLPTIDDVIGILRN